MRSWSWVLRSVMVLVVSSSMADEVAGRKAKGSEQEMYLSLHLRIEG